MTLLAVAAGVTSIPLSMHGHWPLAVAAILFACLMDGLDGRVAHLLKASSRIGEQLDSLADLVNFGVAPAWLVYCKATEGVETKDQEIYWALWACVMVYVMCACYRLARFNGHLDDERRPEYWKYFFQGVPSPAAAGIVLTPILIDIYAKVLGCEPGLSALGWLSGSVLIFAGIMMVSRIPTFSLKAPWLPRWAQITTIVAMVALNALLTPLYLLSIPVCWFVFRRYRDAEVPQG